jgi:hypothetical protein
MIARLCQSSFTQRIHFPAVDCKAIQEKVRFGAASAVVTAPPSPDGTAEVFRGTERLVPGDRVGGR